MGRQDSGPAAGGASGSDDGLSEAARALRQATRALEESTARMTRAAGGMGAPAAAPTPADAPAAAEAPRAGGPATPDEHARRYYEQLEQAGQVVDVGHDADASELPPGVTHVRRPDGTVERRRFSIRGGGG